MIQGWGQAANQKLNKGIEETSRRKLISEEIFCPSIGGRQDRTTTKWQRERKEIRKIVAVSKTLLNHDK